MSHTGHIESQATKGQTSEILQWGRYEAAQAQFEAYRKKLIHQIMAMEIKQGVNFFTQLHKRIDFYKNHQVMDRIVKSVITGQALEEIHVKYVDEHVHQENAMAQTHEPTYNAPQEQPIEEQIERSRVLTHESQVSQPENPQQQTTESAVQSKTEENPSLVQESTEIQEATSEPLQIVENPTEAQNQVQPDEPKSNKSTSLNVENNQPTTTAEQKTEDIPTQSSLIETPQQSQPHETTNQQPSVEEKPAKEEKTEETPVVKAETTQRAQQKEESSPNSQEVKPHQEKSETLQQNFQENQQTEAKVEAPQQATEISEQQKQLTHQEQTSPEEKKVEQKVEEKKEEVNEQRPEVKEKKEVEKEKQKQQPQDNKEQGATTGKKKKKKNNKK